MGPDHARLALEVAFDLAPVGMAVLDEDRGFRMVNEAYCQMLGYRRDELLGLRLTDITHPEDYWLDRDWHEYVIDDSADAVTRRKRLITRVGETVWVTHDSKKATLGPDSTFFSVSSFNPMTGESQSEAEERARLGWTARIETALQQEDLVLHGQPIMDLGFEEIVQHELLVRMKRPGAVERLIMPGEFMPPAEKYGLVDRIDRWVVEHALELGKDRKVTINLSGSTISQPDLIAWIEKAVRSSETPTENLVFEITETAVVDNLVAAEALVRRLRDLGCQFALDDFGTGYGSLAYLKRFPVDFLKIDMEFVRDMVNNEADRRVVRSITATADLFGIATIAEGVEDADTLELLREFGVDYAQGYYIGRPAKIKR